MIYMILFYKGMVITIWIFAGKHCMQIIACPKTHIILTHTHTLVLPQHLHHNGNDGDDHTDEHQ